MGKDTATLFRRIEAITFSLNPVCDSPPIGGVEEQGKRPADDGYRKDDEPMPEGRNLAQQGAAHNSDEMIEGIPIQEHAAAGKHIHLPEDGCHEKQYLHDAPYNHGNIPKAGAQQSQQQGNPESVEQDQGDPGHREQPIPPDLDREHQGYDHEDPDGMHRREEVAPDHAIGVNG